MGHMKKGALKNELIKKLTLFQEITSLEEI